MTPEQRLNEGREGAFGQKTVDVTYRYRLKTALPPMEQLENAARMLIEHGTLKPWRREGNPLFEKPRDYDLNMSIVRGIKLLWHDAERGEECGEIIIAYPLFFFDKAQDGSVPCAQLMMAIASEPFSAFSFYLGAKIMDVRFPPEFIARFPGQIWPHARVREYLGLAADEPIIGTIVKPKTGLTPEMFSASVTEAALAGARFTKADENMHLRLSEIPLFVGRVRRDLERAGFDLGRGAPGAGKRRFLFAPHITREPGEMREAARLAVEAGANALMFSPYYGGGFALAGEISQEFDVPVYAHTAGMNVNSGSREWGVDSSVYYRLAALYGAAFMQLTAVRGYLLPPDEDKPFILNRLREDGLAGEGGMTLVVAGGLGPANIGANMKALGMEGRMFLAGTSVYSHPDGAGAGVRALILAYRAYRERSFTEKAELLEYAYSLGGEGAPLARALGGV